MKNLHKKLARQDGNDDKTICGRSPIKFTGDLFHVHNIYAIKSPHSVFLALTHKAFQQGFSQKTGAPFQNPPSNKSLNSKKKNDTPFRMSFQTPDLGPKMEPLGRYILRKLHSGVLSRIGCGVQVEN